jgi:hypothetical protein
MFVSAQKTGSKVVTYIAADGSATIRRGGSKAWRCNNPGNLGKGPFSTNHGAIGAYDEEAIFPDRETGHGAMRALLQGPNYGSLSIADALAKYAPADDGNDVEGYQDNVHQWANLDIGRTINSLDSGEMDRLLNAMQRQEGWAEGATEEGGLA